MTISVHLPDSESDSSVTGDIGGVDTSSLISSLGDGGGNEGDLGRRIGVSFGNGPEKVI